MKPEHQFGRAPDKVAGSYLEAYFAPLQPWLNQDDVTEVLINRPGEIWIERAGPCSRQRVAALAQMTLDPCRLLGNANHAQDERAAAQTVNQPCRIGTPPGIQQAVQAQSIVAMLVAEQPQQPPVDRRIGADRTHSPRDVDTVDGRKLGHVNGQDQRSESITPSRTASRTRLARSRTDSLAIRRLR